jgi:NifU-like protein involved in Fe-S cluster formation
VIGASLDELQAARDGLKAMLKDGGAPPQGRFADLQVLQVVKDYPARHASTMLAFEAAVEAAQRAHG